MTTTNTCRCFTNCSPQAAAITITEVTVEIDGDVVQEFNDYFLGINKVLVGAVYTFTLSHTPIASEGVHMSVNGVTQGEDVAGGQQNFSVVGDTVTVNFTPDDADEIHFWYIGSV